jgi:hypothetical protein
MKTLQEILESKGFILTESRSVTPRARAIQQAKAMLRKIDAMKSVDELNSETTTQNWWSPQSVEDQRRIVIRYGGATVPNTGTFVDNTLPAVRDAGLPRSSGPVTVLVHDGSWRYCRGGRRSGS